MIPHILTSMRTFYLNNYKNDLEYIKEHTVPTISSDEVLIKVSSCAVSSMDRNIQNGYYKDIETPKVLGFYVSGVISKLGDNVEGVNIGDKVVAISPFDQGGGFADYVCVHKMNIVKLPEGLDESIAVSILHPGIKAYTCLYYKMKITSGSIILLFNGSSPEGQLVIQIAQSLDAYIIAVASNNEEYSFLQSLEYKNIVSILTNKQNVVDHVMEITNGIGVDCIIDFCEKFEHSITTMINCLSVHGIWITQSSVQLDQPISDVLLKKGASLCFIYEPSWTLAPTQHGRLLHIIENLLNKLSQGLLKLQSPKVYEFEKANEALLETEKSFDNIIIKM